MATIFLDPLVLKSEGRLMMKGRWVCLFAGAVVLTIVLLTSYQPVVAAPPAGEVKTVAASFGNEIPIPHREQGHALDWIGLLYDPLVGTTPEGKFSPDLGLSNRWEMNRDGLTWTFYLRKGVKFHDGVEVTSKDVKFSIEQHMTPDAIFGKSPYIRENVKSIEVKDPYALTIHCKQPAIFLLNIVSNLEGLCGLVLPKEYYERVGKDEFAKRPIGSGPYKWHSQLVGSFIKLEATESHWRDGVPRYKYMTYLLIPEESTRLAMLRTGEADIARIRRDRVKEALSAGLNMLTKENAAAVCPRPNMQWASPAFSDVRFRKALNLAIDKEAIIKQIFGGLAKPIATYPGSNIFAVGADQTLRSYPYDPQEARRLIKEGGWEGYEFALIIYPRAGLPEFTPLFEALAGYWEKIGLKPKIRVTEFSVWRGASAQRKVQNTISGADDSTGPDVATLLEKLEERWYFKNVLSAVNIPELNERFEKIEKSLDVAEISKLMAEIYRYAYDYYLMIPICEFPEKIATTKKMPKWDPGLRRQDRNYYDLIRQQ
jgi:peptide/nickel transport system substrate-binding protein